MLKKFSYFMFLVLCMFSFLTITEAASLSIKANTQTVVTGGSVTVTINANGLAGKFAITSSNGNILSGGTSSVWIENETKTYKFNAKNIGSAKIEVVPLDVADSDGKVFAERKSVTVNVVKPREKSSNNNLKSLSVNGYELIPSFNKDVLEYTVNLESNVEKINIHAEKEDGYASLEGTGEKEVHEGDNQFEIIVTSETGNRKVYTINAIVKDSNPIIKEIDGESYTVIKRASTLTKPDSFMETKTVIDGVEVPAFINETLNLTLIGLKSSQGDIELYKYDINTTECEKYSYVISKSHTIIFEETEEEKLGFTKGNITIGNQEYMAYSSDYNKDYVLLYGTDLETGSKNWYLYHVKEESIQLYMEDMVNQLEKDQEKIESDYKVILLGMAGLSFILLLIIFFQMISKIRMKKKLLKRISVLNKEKEELGKEKVEENERKESPKKDLEIKELITEKSNSSKKKRK